MARGLTGPMLAAIRARHVRPISLVALNFASGPVYLWSGLGSLTWGGMTFTGAGTLGAISNISETSDGSARGVVLSLSGIPPSMIALAVGQQYQGGLAQIWLGCFDVTTSAIIADPYLFFQGAMDVMSIQDGTQTAVITLSCENRLIELDRPRERRYTALDQQIDYPADTGLNYINSIQNLQVYWGDPSGPRFSQPGAGGIGTLN